MESRRTILWLYLACAGFFGLFARGYIENTDVEMTLHAARAWYLRGDPGFVGADQTALLEPGQETWPAEHAVAKLISDPVQPKYGWTGVNGRHYVWFPIGHQALFVPCVALGELLTEWFPEPEQAHRARLDPVFGGFFWSRFLASFVSPFAAAGSVVLLLLLARRFGAPTRAALLITGVACLATQFWPGASETMSNVPGTAFLLLTVYGIVAYVQGGAPRALLGAGLAAGAGVLIRYPIVLTLIPFGVWAAVHAWRRRRVRDLLWLVAGGAPFALALAYANWARFGSILETGYSGGASFAEFPMWQGLIGILVAPGKGLLWFSVPVALAVFLAVRRRCAGTMTAALGLLLPILLFSTVSYWGGGRCWGVRYLTGATALLIVISFAVARPWRAFPRTFAVVTVLGLGVSIGGVITPYTGHIELAFQAGEQIYGPDRGGLVHNVNFSPRLSPLHGHWRYAWLSANGELESDSLEPLFGVAAPRVRPLPATDTGFRHVWWRSLPLDAPGAPAGWLALAWLSLTAGAWALALRNLLGRGREMCETEPPR